MSNSLHFWPEDLASDLPSSPVTVLKEAAVELREATKGAIEADLELDAFHSDQRSSTYDFVLDAKALGFRHKVLSIAFNPPAFYPCDLFFEGERYEVEDESAMRKELAGILQSKVVVVTVKSLLAQSLAA